MTGARIVVVGATGYTGSLVARELASTDLPFLLTGRDPEKLERLTAELRAEGGAEPPDPGRATGEGEPGPGTSGAAGSEPRIDTARVDVTEPATLRAVLRRGDVVLSCAGPFLELGEPVVRACVEAGAHYLDTTGEQAFMKHVADTFQAAARDAGVAVVNAMAFEFAVGDAAAALAAEGLEAPLERVEVIYGWRGGAAATSRGTRASILRVLASPGFVYRGGEWHRERPARRQALLDLPDGSRRRALSFPAGEIVIVPRHTDVREVRGWIVAGDLTARAAALFSRVLPSLVRFLLPLLERVVRAGPRGPTEEERRSGDFEIVARATGAGGRTRTVRVRGRDPYGLTVDVLLAGARRLLGTGGATAARGGDGEAGRETGPGTAPEAVPAGVLPPTQLIPAAELLDGLAKRGLRWERTPPA